MEWVAWVAVGVLAVAALDRLALRAEARGWVYWRRRRGSAGVGAALDGLMDVFQPGHQHLVSERQRRRIVASEVASSAPAFEVDLDRGVVVVPPPAPDAAAERAELTARAAAADDTGPDDLR